MARVCALLALLPAAWLAWRCARHTWKLQHEQPSCEMTFMHPRFELVGEFQFQSGPRPPPPPPAALADEGTAGSWWSGPGQIQPGAGGGQGSGEFWRRSWGQGVRLTKGAAAPLWRIVAQLLPGSRQTKPYRLYKYVDGQNPAPAGAPVM
jgi:hypothetical protein